MKFRITNISQENRENWFQEFQIPKLLSPEYHIELKSSGNGDKFMDMLDKVRRDLLMEAIFEKLKEIEIDVPELEQFIENPYEMVEKYYYDKLGYKLQPPFEELTEEEKQEIKESNGFKQYLAGN